MEKKTDEGPARRYEEKSPLETGMVERNISNDFIQDQVDNEAQNDDQADNNEASEGESEMTRQELFGRFDGTCGILKISSDEAIEEYEIPASAPFPRGAEENITKTRLSIARSRILDRAASMLEQRLRIISGLKELYGERGRLALKNRFLNKKCCEFIKKTTTFEMLEIAEGALPIHENQRYHAVLEEYTKTKTEYENTRPLLEREVESITDSYETRRTTFERVLEEFTQRELQIGFQCINGKTGKFMGEQRAASLVKKQRSRFDTLAKVRVYYLKLNHRLADIRAKVYQLNLMGEGRTLVDHEQLVTENSSYVDKLDEREEELLKIRNKCAQCLSILRHMMETCDVFVYDITNEAAKLADVVRKKGEARTLLAIERAKRESLRKATAEIRHASGLLGSPIIQSKIELDSKALDMLKQRTELVDSSFNSR